MSDPRRIDRRTFLETASLATAGLWLGGCATAPVTTPAPSAGPRRVGSKEKLRVACIGLGAQGSGVTGDMAVHHANPAFYALDLGAPDRGEAQTAPTNPDSFPEWSILTYHFPAKGSRGPVKMIWYDGGKLPPHPPQLEAGRELGDNGIYFVGTDGVLLAPGWSGTPRLVPESRMQSYQRPPKTIPRSVGHRREWVDACRTGRPEDAKAGFWYSAPFTEALLVGVLPILAGKRIAWDARTLSATNAPELAPVIRKRYRAGYGLPLDAARIA